MKATIKWLDGVSFAGESDSGHAVVLDGPPEAGGRNVGMRPMAMLLIGMGGCTAFDVVSILAKGRQSIADCRVEISADRAAAPPRVFTRIHVRFIVSGRNIKLAQVTRAVELSMQKYCSASIMLGKTAEITHDCTVLEVSDAP